MRPQELLSINTQTLATFNQNQFMGPGDTVDLKQQQSTVEEIAKKTLTSQAGDALKFIAAELKSQQEPAKIVVTYGIKDSNATIKRIIAIVLLPLTILAYALGSSMRHLVEDTFAGVKRHTFDITITNFIRADAT